LQDPLFLRRTDAADRAEGRRHQELVLLRADIGAVLGEVGVPGLALEKLGAPARALLEARSKHNAVRETTWLSETALGSFRDVDEHLCKNYKKRGASDRYPARRDPGACLREFCAATRRPANPR
jgi:hypothetical protein